VKSVGTGVLVSPEGLAGTAYHVIKGAQRIEAVLSDGRIINNVKVIKYNELTDAALVKLPDPQEKGGSYSVVPVRESVVRSGERVFAMGYPLKNTPIITEGIVNHPNAEVNGRGRILTSAEIASGMSGGPLLDQHGRLAGIISGSMRTMNNIHLIINTDDLRSIMPAKAK